VWGEGGCVPLPVAAGLRGLRGLVTVRNVLAGRGEGYTSDRPGTARFKGGMDGEGPRTWGGRGLGTFTFV